jgi:hypothetical protein
MRPQLIIVVYILAMLTPCERTPAPEAYEAAKDER